MKRFIAIVAFALTLSGCAGVGTSIFEGGTSVTATINNPVTLDQQAAIEASYNLLASAALNYSRLRRCKAGESAGVTNLCSSWSVVKQLMKADQVAYTSVSNLRKFMRENQTVSAISAFNAAQAAFRDYKAIAYINGVKTSP